MMSLWCLHPNQTTPRHDMKGDYRRCLDCGARVPWSWADESPIHAPQVLELVRSRLHRFHLKMLAFR
jgi:hypothetical protein